MSETPETPATPEALIARVAQHLPPAPARLGVAFSGGVDSATLTAVAAQVLGAENVLAIMAVSPSLARRERRRAHATARQIGVKLVEVETHEDQNEHYQENGTDRCYFCKSEMFEAINAGVVDKHSLSAVAYGENADDAQRPDRPGARAATEHQVLRPLAEAGLTKQDVRAIAAYFGLEVADKPAAPCLASRVPHGIPVDPEKLRQIEQLEDTLFDLGFSDCRVRHHETIARIEVPPAELPRALEHRAAITAAAKKLGFQFATLDLGGLQSGAMTLQALAQEGKLRYV